MQEITYKNVKENYKNILIEVSIDGKSVEINSNAIFNMLETSDQKFEEFLNGKRTFEPNYTNNVLGYIAVNFFNYFDNLKLPQDVQNRLDRISKSDLLDISYINKILETDDKNLSKVVLDKNFEKEILNSIPKEYNSLEKVIYIYIKLCDILTYDPAFYINEQPRGYISKHQDIKYTQKVNKKNNKVVCYNFNSILGKLLDDLGIKYESKPSTYGYGTHAYNICRIDDNLIKLDSCFQIIGNDMSNIKLGIPPRGITVLNKSPETKIRIMETINKVYSDYMLSHGIKKIDVQKKNLEENIKKIIEEYKTSDLEGIDLMYYIKLLNKILLDDYKGETTFIRGYKNLEVEPVIVLSFENNEDYIILNSFNQHKNNRQINKMNKNKLKDKFENHLYEYIETPGKPEINKVPGIEYSKKGKTKN